MAENVSVLVIINRSTTLRSIMVGELGTIINVKPILHASLVTDKLNRSYFLVNSIQRATVDLPSIVLTKPREAS